MNRIAAVIIATTSLLVGCTEVNIPPTTTAPSVTVIQNQQSHNSGEGATQTPGGDGAIYRVKVGFFGGTCPSGPLPAGSTELAVNCTGDMTATPKVLIEGGGDRDATQAEHGPESLVEWTSTGDDVLKCVTSPANGFNRICSAKKVGNWSQCAFVRGVKGCASGAVL